MSDFGRLTNALHWESRKQFVESQRDYAGIVREVNKPLAQRDSHRIGWLWGQLKAALAEMRLNAREYDTLEMYLEDREEDFAAWALEHNRKASAQTLRMMIRCKTLHGPAHAEALERELIWPDVKAAAWVTPGGITAKRIKYIRGVFRDEQAAERVLVSYLIDGRLKECEPGRYVLPEQQRPKVSSRTKRFFKTLAGAGQMGKR